MYAGRPVGGPFSYQGSAATSATHSLTTAASAVRLASTSAIVSNRARRRSL